uniref:ATP synthase subunit a n=1 Tax=Sternotherus carinatus TaxID=573971 RepID=H9L9M6_9SAUR|nr:ATP synthase F0 subunit 6 [Sternotherus carinatus]ADM94812.1 ATP synthase F0 subunit 6 [Sternotherus carinatus]WLN41550.1 ATP synthase F0 subunit 6 [Sternotherus carinatus]
MNLTLFDQFMSPQILGMNLSILALLMPSIIFPTKNNQVKTNPLLTFQLWLTHMFTKQLMPVVKTNYQWSLILTTLLCMLLTTNLLGLLPYTFTPTAQLSMNMGLAIPLWLATVITGFTNQPTKSLAHLLPEGTPTPLVPALIIIETISLLMRPLALGVRLTANLTAGHLLIQLISTAMTTLLPTMPTVSLLTMIILFLLTVLELAVAMIQAYVFALLLSLYLEENS